MSSEPIGESSHLEAIPILPPMLTTDISFEPIYLNPSLTPIIPSMLFFLSLMMILDIPSIGIMKDPRMTKKSNDND